MGCCLSPLKQWGTRNHFRTTLDKSSIETLPCSKRWYRIDEVSRNVGLYAKNHQWSMLHKSASDFICYKLSLKAEESDRRLTFGSQGCHTHKSTSPIIILLVHQRYLTVCTRRSYAVEDVDSCSFTHTMHILVWIPLFQGTRMGVASGHFSCAPSPYTRPAV